MLVFIKGTQGTCEGESRDLWEFLNSLKLKYNTFNVLSDPLIRQWLKFYSKFPSYPQVFIKGQFIGGFNVIYSVLGKNGMLEIAPSESIKTSALEKIKTISSKSFITIFMKGTPENPKDEYQSILLDWIHKNKFVYGYFDVTTDSDLREQLKEYTNCTSYPQVFLGKKFYSGMSDFIKLLESGKALSIIPTTEVVMKPHEKLINLLEQSRIVALIEGEKMVPENRNSMEIIDFMEKYKISCTY